jgi:carbon storage regulator CsrA
MLAVSRRPGEKLILPTLGVTIEVLEIQGDKVRLRVAAPSGVTVVRQELTVVAASSAQRGAGSLAGGPLPRLGI